MVLKYLGQFSTSFCVVILCLHIKTERKIMCVIIRICVGVWNCSLRFITGSYVTMLFM